jgi:predicted ATPase/DNA-binding SARP family transcriptional activator
VRRPGRSAILPRVSGPLTIRVLGPLDLERAGRPLVLGSRLQRRLLLTLVAAHGATLAGDRLVEELWGEHPPAAPANALHSHVARLRDALGDRQLVRTRPSGYALDVERVEVDADRFEAAVEQARAQLATAPADAARILDGALDCWRGAAYAEVADGTVRAAGVRLDRLRGEARMLHAEALAHAGAVPAACTALRALLADEPLREDAAVALARLLAADGRRVEALDVLRAQRERLADELGLDPTAPFATAEHALLRGELPGSAGAGTSPPLAIPRAVAASPPDTAPSPSPTSAPPSPAGAPTTPSTTRRPPRIGTATVGRGELLAKVDAALACAPLVTLVGPGGVGKSRIAAEVASRRTPSAWVDLGRVRAGADVAAAVAEGIGVAVPTGSDADASVALALGRFPGTVVIDNCEHLLDAVAGLVDRTLADAVPVRLLATSRERLDVAGEAVLPVTPLPVPAPDHAGPEDPVVALFQARLGAAGGQAVPAADAARVAAAVDGLPLAIELAAARAAALPVATLLERLPHHLDVLAGTNRRHGTRQRTLTDVIRWSYDLLDPAERRLFGCLSVFAGGFGPAEVERVCGDGQRATATLLAGLVERSMVVRLDRTRYRLLEPLRVFAAERLDADVAADVRRTHLAWALELAARADAEMTGPDEAGLVPAVEAALPDLRAAHAHARAEGDGAAVARLAAGLSRLAYVQGRQDVLAWGEGSTGDGLQGADLADPDRLPMLRAQAAAVAAAWMGGRLTAARTLAASYEPWVEEGRIDDPLTRTTLTESLGDLRLMTGDLPGALRAFTANLEAANALGHDGLRSQALAGLAITHAFRGEHDAAERTAERACRLADREGVASAGALAAYALGEALAGIRPDAALAALDRAIDLADRVGARFFEGLARTADVALRGRHGDPAEALARYEAALRVWHDTGADGLVLTTLRNLVVLLVRVGSDAAATTLDAAMQRLVPRDAYGDEADRLQRARRAAADRLGADRLTAARREAEDLRDLDAVRRVGLRAIGASLGGGADGSR